MSLFSVWRLNQLYGNRPLIYQSHLNNRSNIIEETLQQQTQQSTINNNHNVYCTKCTPCCFSGFLLLLWTDWWITNRNHWWFMLYLYWWRQGSCMMVHNLWWRIWYICGHSHSLPYILHVVEIIRRIETYLHEVSVTDKN